MDTIYEKILEVREQGLPAALVTVIQTKGSTPRKSGSKMIVLQDGTIFGSVGGSKVEALVIKESLDCIHKNLCRKTEHTLDDEKDSDTGMICGGWMEFFIEPLKATAHLYIFGAGHVALPLARLANDAGFSYTIIEDRAEVATKERFPNAREIKIGDPVEIIKDINFKDSDFIAIVSRSHEQDFFVLKKVLNEPHRYLGIIGSEKKKKDFFIRLKRDGVSDKELEQIHVPIGLDIAAETPEEIAVSIVAELIKVKNS
jgi:xanthine dehydrogenase accessory factor